MYKTCRRFIFVFVMISCIFAIAGCHSNNEDERIPKKGEIALFYQLAGSQNLETEIVELSNSEADFQALVEWTFQKLTQPTNPNHISVIPKNIFISECTLSENGILTVTFPENYYDMEPVAEILFRAAFVKTMIQLPNVSFVSFYVGERSLVSASGCAYGPMNAATFVSDVEDAMENLAWLSLTLYYSDETGTSLVGENTRLAYSQSISIEQVIVEQLIKGPYSGNMKSALPSNLSVISAVTRDGICYVNLNGAFLDSVADCTSQVSIYSIVNSLCELSNVLKVQIMVNGGQDYVFRDKYSLMDNYERDLNLINGPKPSSAQTEEAQETETETEEPERITVPIIEETESDEAA